MKETSRLEFLSQKTEENLTELWENCFSGDQNLEHMNAHVPIPLTHSFQLYGFLRRERGYKTWLIKRKEKQDIIGFAVHGNFIPGLPNNIGFNIGLKYTRQGYGKETLMALVNYLRNEGFKETFGHCFESNTPSIRTMETVGFINSGSTGRIFNRVSELKFKIEL